MYLSLSPKNVTMFAQMHHDFVVTAMVWAKVITQTTFVARGSNMFHPVYQKLSWKLCVTCQNRPINGGQTQTITR